MATSTAGTGQAEVSEDVKREPAAGASAAEDRCPICLEDYKNKAFVDACFHAFCFNCICRSADVGGARCPMCKTGFKVVVHNVRANDDYDVFKVKPKSTDSSRLPVERINLDEALRTFRGYRTTVLPGQFRPTPTASSTSQSTSSASREGEIRSTQASTCTSRRHSHGRKRKAAAGSTRKPATLERRRAVYSTGLRVKPLEERDGRKIKIRDISPSFFRENPACAHRLVPWLTREFNVLVGEEHVEFLIQIVLSLIDKINLESSEFANHLRPFLHDNTSHFMHELIFFAKSPYDMVAYDNKVKYDWPEDHPIRESGGWDEDTTTQPGPSGLSFTDEWQQRILEELTTTRWDDSPPLLPSLSPVLVHDSDSEPTIFISDDEESMDGGLNVQPLQDDPSVPPSDVQPDVSLFPSRDDPSVPLSNDQPSRDDPLVPLSNDQPSRDDSLVLTSSNQNLPDDPHVFPSGNQPSRDNASVFPSGNQPSRDNSSVPLSTNQLSQDDPSVSSFDDQSSRDDTHVPPSYDRSDGGTHTLCSSDQIQRAVFPADIDVEQVATTSRATSTSASQNSSCSGALLEMLKRLGSGDGLTGGVSCSESTSRDLSRMSQPVSMEAQVARDLTRRGETAVPLDTDSPQGVNTCCLVSGEVSTRNTSTDSKQDTSTSEVTSTTFTDLVVQPSNDFIGQSSRSNDDIIGRSSNISGGGVSCEIGSQTSLLPQPSSSQSQQTVLAQRLEDENDNNGERDELLLFADEEQFPSGLDVAFTKNGTNKGISEHKETMTVTSPSTVSVGSKDNKYTSKKLITSGKNSPRKDGGSSSKRPKLAEDHEIYTSKVETSKQRHRSTRKRNHKRHKSRSRSRGKSPYRGSHGKYRHHYCSDSSEEEFYSRRVKSKTSSLKKNDICGSESEYKSYRSKERNRGHQSREEYTSYHGDHDYDRHRGRDSPYYKREGHHRTKLYSDDFTVEHTRRSDDKKSNKKNPYTKYRKASKEFYSKPRSRSTSSEEGFSKHRSRKKTVSSRLMHDGATGECDENRKRLSQELNVLDQQIKDNKKELLKSMLRRERMELIQRHLRKPSMVDSDQFLDEHKPVDCRVASANEMIQELVFLDQAIVDGKKQLLKVMKTMEEDQVERDSD